MTTQYQFQAVIEYPWFDDESPLFGDRSPLWEIETGVEPFSFLQLSSKTTDAEVGLIIAELIDFNNLESQGSLTDRLMEIIEHQSVDDGDYLSLAGGIQAFGDDFSISPSCCCELEDWRDWLNFLSTGESPFLGHQSDSPHLERVDDRLIRVVMDCNYADLDRQVFESKLLEVQQDLADFLVRIESWANRLGFAESGKLAAKFDRCFSISKQWNK
jgi:hypothetical protein